MGTTLIQGIKQADIPSYYDIREILTKDQAENEKFISAGLEVSLSLDTKEFGEEYRMLSIK